MKKIPIDPREISVVVRGLVVGNQENDEKNKFTKRSLESVRKILPGAQIILSTWKGSDVTGLDYDILVLNDEPEKIYMTTGDGFPKLIAANNQIVSSINGLIVSDRKYILNMRSDIELVGTNFLFYFKKFNQNYRSGILKQRVVVLPTYNPRKNTKILFDVCDWFFFGLKEDVQNIFSIPLMNMEKLQGEKINGYFQISKNFESETYIWSSFLKKYKNIEFPNQSYFSEKSLSQSEESYARYTVMLPANKAKVRCLKMPKAGYGAVPWLSQGLYTFNEYKKILNKYCEDKVLYFPNIIENIVYFIALHTRLFFKKYFPGGYKKIVNIVRRFHGSQNFLK